MNALVYVLLFAIAFIGYIIQQFLYAPLDVVYITVDDLRSSYDFIVCGAGIGGSVIASRIATDPSHPSVLLLEAGDKACTHRMCNEIIPALTATGQLTDIDWQYQTTSQRSASNAYNQNKQQWPRGKTMGGSSVLNYMVWMRGNPDDWNVFNNENVSEWDYESVLPYFKKVENIQTDKHPLNPQTRGTDGPITVRYSYDLQTDRQLFQKAMIEAAEKHGIPFTTDFNNGYDQNPSVGYTQFNVDLNGKRVSAFRGYIENVVMSDPNYKEGNIKLDILPNAHVSRIVFEKDGSTNQNVATGVEFIDLKTKTTHTVNLSSKDKGEVIVSGGSIGSPHILMLSGVGPKNELKKHNIEVIEDIKGVGKSLQDHPGYVVRYVVNPENATLFHEIMNADSVTGFQPYFDYLVHGSGILTTSGTDVHVFLTTEATKKKYGKNVKYPDVEVICIRGFWAAEQYFNQKTNWMTENNYNCTAERFYSKEFWSDTSDLDNFAFMLKLLHPESKGEILLNSNDPLDHPLINPNSFMDKYDSDVLIDATRELQKMMKHIDDIEQVVCDKKEIGESEALGNSDEALRQYIKDTSITIYHPSSTCKFGDLENDDMAVLDQKLKLRNTKNVRVADLSVIPRLTSGNTQTIAYMVGEKGAYYVLEEWNKS